MKKENMLNKKFTLIAILGVIVFCFFSNENKIFNDNNKYKFAIEDTSSITKIFLADRNGTSVLLEKTNNNWILNNKYNVKKSSINILLSTIKDIRVHKSVPKNATENVIKDIATNGIKVEIYKNKKNLIFNKNQSEILKSFTLGQPTSDYLSNYMINNDEKTPYIVNIPGFNGFLTPRFGVEVNNLEINSWRSTLIFNKSFKQINQITLRNYLDTTKSFSINTKKSILYNFEFKPVITNKIVIDKYTKVCSKLNCESFKNSTSKDYNKLIYELIIDSDTLKIYKLDNNVFKHKEHNYNVKRMLAVFNNNQYMLIQHHVFNKVLINIDELIN